MMKSSIIITTLFTAVLAQACPDISGTFICPAGDGATYKMKNRMEKVANGYKLTISNEYAGEDMGTEIFSMTPVDARVDEVGILSKYYCEADKMVIDSSHGELKGKLFVTTPGASTLLIEGTSVVAEYETDKNDKPIQSSIKYQIDGAPIVCLREK